MKRGVIVAVLVTWVGVGAWTQEHNVAPKAPKAPQFPALSIEPEKPRYSGELITLSLKDADIRDVIKTFAVLTDLNMVVDSSVRGSVTLELRDVPWDQAFELILHINGLDYHMTNNVVYVAPPAKLARVPLG